jgi:hypothetical protein
MADEQILVNIKVESDEVVQAKNKISQLTDSIEELSNTIASAKKQNDAYKDTQRELEKQYKNNKISADTFIQEIDKLNSKISANNKLIAENKIQLSKENSERNANIKLISAEVGAYTQLSNQYSIAAKKAKDLGAQYGVNSQQFKEASAAANTLQNELKEIDNAVGQNQRNVGNYSGSIQGLKKELRELKGVLLNAKEGTDEYNKALKRSAQIADDIADMNERVKGTAMDLDGVMGNVGKTTQGVASAFEAAQGAQILFGNESEDLQKAMLKVQASIALANGLQGLEGMGKAFKNLLFQIKTFASGVNKALLTTGIGVFVVALGGIAAYWDTIKEKVSGVSSEQRKLNELGSKKLELSKMELQNIEASDNILKLEGKSERQILNIKLERIKLVLGEAEADLERINKTSKLEYEASQKNKANLKAILNLSAGGINILLKGVDLIGKAFGKDWDLSTKLNDWAANLLFDPEEVKTEGDASIKAAEDVLRDLKNQYAGYQLSLRELDRKGAEDRKKLDEDNIKAKEENTKKLAELADEERARDLENFNKQNDEILSMTEGFIEEQKKLDEDAKTEKLESDKKQADEELRIQEEKTRAIEELKKGIITTFADETESYISDLADIKREEKLTKIKDNQKIQEDLLKNQLDKGLISEDEYNKQVSALAKKTRIEEAKASKKKTLFDIAISTAAAVVKALPNFILAAGVAAAGAIKAAFVAARPIPEFGSGVNDIVSIGDSHASGNDVSVWGFAGNKKQFFGKVEKGEAMPVIRKSAVNDYMVSQLNGKYSPNNRTFANGTPDITQQNVIQNNENMINSFISAMSNIQVVAKIEDITKQANRKMEIVSNSKV